VRPCYQWYFELVDNLIDQGCTFLMLCGTPGTGKSTFYQYFFETYRLKYPEKSIYCAAFESDGHRRPGGILFRNAKDPGIKDKNGRGAQVCLFDGPGLSRVSGKQVHIVFVSPNSQMLSFCVNRVHSQVLWMPNWTSDELLFAARFLSEKGQSCPSPDEILERIRKYGPVPRVCLANNDDFEDQVERYSSGVSFIDSHNTVKNLLSINSRQTSSVVELHRFVSIVPLNDPTGIPACCRVEFGSSYLSDQVALQLNRLHDIDRHLLRDLLNGADDRAGRNAFLEWEFLHHCHEMLNRGGTFRLQRINNGEAKSAETETLVMSSSQADLFRFNSFASVTFTDQPVYAVPTGQTCPSIDGIYGDTYAFKMCVYQKGAIVSSKGIKEFAKASGKLNLLEKQPDALKLVFVVPKVVSDSYVNTLQNIDFSQNPVSEIPGIGSVTASRLLDLQPPVTTVVEFIQSYCSGRNEFKNMRFDPRVHEYMSEYMRGIQKQEDDAMDERNYGFMKRIPQYVLPIDPILHESRICSLCQKTFTV
jgi:hypothetical protein